MSSTDKIDDTKPAPAAQSSAALSERCCNLATTLMSSFNHSNQEVVNQAERHKAVAELVNTAIQLLQVSFLTTTLSVAQKQQQEGEAANG